MSVLRPQSQVPPLLTRSWWRLYHQPVSKVCGTFAEFTPLVILQLRLIATILSVVGHVLLDGIGIASGRGRAPPEQRTIEEVVKSDRYHVTERLATPQRNELTVILADDLGVHEGQPEQQREECNDQGSENNGKGLRSTGQLVEMEIRRSLVHCEARALVCNRPF